MQVLNIFVVINCSYGCLEILVSMCLYGYKYWIVFLIVVKLRGLLGLVCVCKSLMGTACVITPAVNCSSS